MANASAFWSYVHRDDTAEGDRITRLARDLSAQYELITGESITLFIDRDDIEWGDEWHGVIDASLASITFFIPIITPRYFQSTECRREFSAFARKATRLGVKELVMPILYIRFPALDADPPPDELITLAKSFHWEDWTERRFETLDSKSYRESVARMAERLAKASVSLEQIDVPADGDASSNLDDADDDSPGFVDRIVTAEIGMQDWVVTLGEIKKQIEVIGELVTAASAEMKLSDARTGSMAGRVRLYAELAGQLQEPTQQVQDLGNSFTRQLNDVDSGIRAIFEKLAEELENGEATPDSLSKFDEFDDQLHILSTTVNSGLSPLQGMIDSIAGAEKQSRTLRPVLRRMRRGLAVLIDARTIIQQWVELSESAIAQHDAEGGDDDDAL